MKRIRKGDSVIILSGRSKGDKGVVLKLLENSVLVEGINKVYKHKKQNPQSAQKGGILEKEAPIHISKVALYDSNNQKPGRIGYRNLANGKKIRYFRETDEMVK